MKSGDRLALRFDSDHPVFVRRTHFGGGDARVTLKPKLITSGYLGNLLALMPLAKSHLIRRYFGVMNFERPVPRTELTADTGCFELSGVKR
jgi:hypothetical protein